MIIHGKNILILKSDGTTLIGAAKSCDIDVDVDTEEVSSSSNGEWKTYRTKRKGWSTSISHLVTSLKGTILQVGDSVTLKIAIAGDSSDADSLTGTAIVRQGRITGGVGNLAQGSVSLLGTGPLSEVTSAQ